MGGLGLTGHEQDAWRRIWMRIAAEQRWATIRVATKSAFPRNFSQGLAKRPKIREEEIGRAAMIQVNSEAKRS
jgi:hypothetical protein